MEKTLDGLKRYINNKISIFPCNKEKKPLTEHGFKNATYEEKQVMEWVGKFSNCCWGMPTGEINGMTVLDIDPRHGGHISIRDFNIPPTPYVKTGGGGIHYYFKYSPKCKTGSDIIAPGLDIRNDGGYAIIPPSTTVFGEYFWCDEDVPMAEAPDWMFTERYESLNNSFDLKKQGYPIPQGQQDNTLFRIVCGLKRQGQPSGLIADVIRSIIKDTSKCPQTPGQEFSEKDIERWLKSAFKYPESEEEKRQKSDPILFFNPISTKEFLKKEIPPIQWHIKGILQQKGRTMISAKENIGKSFMVLNMLSAICSKKKTFIDKFEIGDYEPRALYIDFELGESSLQSRLKKMGEIINLDNLFVQTIYGWELLSSEHQAALEQIIVSKKINIIAFDPLGNIYSGDENKRNDVKKVTDYLDYLMDTFGTSILMTHHWRKSTKDFREGGEMAAGSYMWAKWLDNHITMTGTLEALVLSCEKNRNDRRWGKITASINPETFLMQYSGDLENIKKFTDEDLVGLFRSFNQKRVKQPDLIDKGKNVCSKSTLYDLIKYSRTIGVDKTKKPYELFEKEQTPEYIGEWEE